MLAGFRHLLFRGLLAWAVTALGAAHPWDGPTRGPAPQRGRTVVFLASDSRNGGVTGVFRGFEGAAALLGWKVLFLDGGGTPGGQDDQWARALAQRPDGIILGGFDAEGCRERLDQARKARIPVVGWHAAPEPGPAPGLFLNIATSTREVAEQAVTAVARDAEAKKQGAGIVLFTDSRFAVARAKTQAMARAVGRNPRLRLLSVEDVPIARAHDEIPALVARLAARHGAAWTHCLAINDVYFDHISFPLAQAGRGDIAQVAAGDGSSLALARIRSGLSRQIATVAEPLRLQGYQLADELNRALAGAPPSGYRSRPLLVTPALLMGAREGDVEADLGFEEGYARLWK